MKQITWKITKPMGAFVSLDELVSSIQDVVRDDVFVSKISHFYISKYGLKELWIVAFLEGVNAQSVLSFMKMRLQEKGVVFQAIPDVVEEINIINPEYSPHKLGESDFRAFLHDNTLICLDLYRGDLLLAKKKALFSKFSIKPFGPLDAKVFLHEFFAAHSPHYVSIVSDNRGERFWNCFTCRYDGATYWGNFFYDLILGSEPDRFKPIFHYTVRYWSNLMGLNISDQEILDMVRRYRI